MTTTSLTGLSPRAVGVLSIFLTTSIPSTMLPNTTCLPFSHGVAVVVMKNCDPLVLGPALAMERTPGPTWLSLSRGKGLIRELAAVDGVPARAVTSLEITALDHEVGDDAVEDGVLVPEVLSPVASCLKFSTVFGTSLPNRPMTILPWGSPPMDTSKYTLLVTSALHKRGAVSAVGHESASAGQQRRPLQQQQSP